MEAMQAILSRKSIRKYTTERIPQNTIEVLLKAAMSAPSAANEQPWHFVVIEDHEILDKIPEFHPYSGMLREAPLAIVICGDRQPGEAEVWWAQDCSAATENLLIAANANGLGAVWLGIYPKEERVAGMRKLLGLPENMLPLCVVPVGYPAEKKPEAQRYDPTRIHRNIW